MKCRFLKVSGLLAMLTLPAIPPVSQAQSHFRGAEEAANRLVIAVARHDEGALTSLLGEGYRELLPVEQIDAAAVERFLNDWAGYHTLLPLGDKVRMLAVGENGWTLPIPLVREVAGWRFDTKAGREQMRVRRIGRNELFAMQAALAYHDAQIEYALADHDGDGVLEYAQRFISDKGTHDGLYWEPTAGQPESPLGPLFNGKVPADAYHGYYYRILTAQGKHAPGGAEDYLRNGKLVGGFALVAWPAIYGDTGVMSFLLSRNGTLYQADLGRDGATFASAMLAFDPDGRWLPVSAEFTDLEQ